MNQYKILIEETITQKFEIKASTPEEALMIAEREYKNADLILEPGNLIDVQFYCIDD
jgi:hypothetical protein